MSLFQRKAALDVASSGRVKPVVLSSMLSLLMLFLCAHNGGQVFRTIGPQVALIVAVVVMCFFAVLVWVRGSVNFTLPGGLLLLWLLYMTVNTFAWGQGSVSGKLLLSVLLSAGCLSYTLYCMDRLTLRGVYIGLAIVGCVLGVVGLFQFIVDPSWHPLVGSVKSQYAGRVASLLGQPNSFAVFMLMLLPYPLLQTYRASKWRLVYVLMSVLFMWCVLASSSRAVIMVSLPVLALVAHFTTREKLKKVRVFTGWLLLYVGLYFVNSVCSGLSGERFGSMVNQGGEKIRKEYYASAIDLFAQEPVLGVGMGNFQTLWDRNFPAWNENTEYFVHSDYLQVLCEGGIVGFALLLAGIVILLIRSYSALVSGADDDQVLGQVALCGLIGFGAHEFVDIGMQMTSVLFLVAIYIGVLMHWCNGHWTLKLAMPGKVVVSVCAIVCAGWGMLVFWPIASSVRKSLEAWRYAAYVHAHLVNNRPISSSQIQGVVSLFDESVELAPTNLEAHWGKGRLLQSYQYKENINMQRVVADSVSTFDAALAIEPEQWRLWADRGVSLSLDSNRLDEAEESFMKAISIAPMHLGTWRYYADFLEKTGQVDELSKVLERMTVLDNQEKLQPWLAAKHQLLGKLESERVDKSE